MTTQGIPDDLRPASVRLLALLAVDEARRNVSSARDMSYRNTGTAIFEVEIGGHGVGADVMLVDKDLTHA